jgi:BirA family biotin operon repressor/biotin-[acetyl-CoA-carboxylase] ligase
LYNSAQIANKEKAVQKQPPGNDSPQWLDATRISDALGALRDDFHIEIFDRVTSTNTLLLDRTAAGAPSGSVIAAEWQSEGHGRAGRTWYAERGEGLTFSLLWRFECGLAGLSGLGLAVGVAVMRALDELGAAGATLKWPNDVLTKTGKLAGILVEAQNGSPDTSAAVIGIGLNLSHAQAIADKVNQPMAALADLVATLPDRNRLLALLLRALHGVLTEFAAGGFAVLRAEWERRHGSQDQPVRLTMPDGKIITGIARGVAEDGTLLLETERGVQRFYMGETSLRGGK